MGNLVVERGDLLFVYLLDGEVLVEVKSDDVLEGKAFFFVESDEFGIDSDGSRSCGKT